MPRGFWLLRRVRFSLRLAAIALTAVCAWLGYFAHSAFRQQAAVAELSRLGASVSYDKRIEEIWAPNWLREFVGNDFFVNVNYVQMSYRTIDRRMHKMTPSEFDAAVAAIAKLPRVRYIYFGHTGVGDDDLRRFA